MVSMMCLRDRLGRGYGRRRSGKGSIHVRSGSVPMVDVGAMLRVPSWSIVVSAIMVLVLAV